MTPFRSVSAGLVLLASLAAPAASAGGWIGWSEFYRSFAVEPPPVRPVKLPGIHKVPDVTLKRGVIGTTPKANVTPKPRSSLDAAPPSPTRGWDPQSKKTITGAPPRRTGATMTAIAMAESNGERSYHGVRLQQGRVHQSALDDMPASPARRYAGSPPPTSAAIRTPVPDDRKHTGLVDDIVRLPPTKGLAQKPHADLPGSGAPFSGKYRTASTTHKLR